MYLNFEHQYYLIFLFAIPVLIFFHFFGLKNLKGRSLKFANFEAISKIKGIDLYSKSIFSLIFNIVFLILLVFALSGLTLYKEVEASSFSFVIAIDSSQSMVADDILPNRISAAKETAVNFVNSLPEESNIAVISFSGDSKVERDMTKNKLDLKDSIEKIDISPVGGTDVFEAIYSSGELLKEEENKAIVLISDGQINTGDLKQTVDYAIENKIIIHAIGIGTAEGGKAEYGLSKIDEDTLKSLAYNSGGRFFLVLDKEKMYESFREIIQVTKKVGSTDLNPHLIMALIFLFLIKQFLANINKIMW